MGAVPCGQYHRAVAGGSKDCRLPIAKCRLAVSLKTNQQSEIDNWQMKEAHPLPRGGTDLMEPVVVLTATAQAAVLDTKNKRE
jgi:hypothetical protein